VIIGSAALIGLMVLLFVIALVLTLSQGEISPPRFA